MQANFKRPFSLDFYQVGSHENFYDELKRYLRAEWKP